MKRILTIALALLLALSLCGCHERNADAAQAAEQPTPEPTEEPKPTPAEAVAAAMEAFSSMENAHFSLSLEFAMTRKTDGQEATVLPSRDNEFFYAQLDADFTKSPYVLKGTLILRLSGDESKEIPICLWQEDGAFYAAYAYSAGSEQKWMGSRFNADETLSTGADLSHYLEQYRTLLCDWAEKFTEAGERTVNGKPATAYEAEIDGEMIRKLLETYTDLNGEPMLTFSDELIKELPPVHFTIAVDADGIPVYQEIDVAAFVSVLIERMLYAQVGGVNEDFSIDVLLLKTTVSDVGAVGPLEPPEDVMIYDSSSAMPGIAGLLGA